MSCDNAARLPIRTSLASLNMLAPTCKASSQPCHCRAHQHSAHMAVVRKKLQSSSSHKVQCTGGNSENPQSSPSQPEFESSSAGPDQHSQAAASEAGSMASAAAAVADLWSSVQAGQLDALNELLPDEALDTILEQRRNSGRAASISFREDVSALNNRCPSLQLDSFAERHLLFSAPAGVALRSQLLVSPSRSLHRYAVKAQGGEECYLTVALSLQEELQMQYRMSPRVVAAWRLASITGEPADSVPATEPSPLLSPEAVVQAQLEALRRSHVATVFAFASYDNQAATGPLPKFAALLSHPIYRPLLRHASARTFKSCMTSACTFESIVAVTSSNTGMDKTLQMLYCWQLEQQPDDGSWRTNGVQLISAAPM